MSSKIMSLATYIREAQKHGGIVDERLILQDLEAQIRMNRHKRVNQRGKVVYSRFWRRSRR